MSKQKVDVINNMDVSLKYHAIPPVYTLKSRVRAKQSFDKD